jgi:hypothetical protein
MDTKHDKFWYNDIKVLFSIDRLTEFFPMKTMNMDEKLNSIARFFIYLGIVLYVYNLSLISMYVPFGGLILTKLLYEHHIKSENFNQYIEDDEDKRLKDEKDRVIDNCVTPTNNNPFMNLKYTDYKDDVDRPKACDVENEGTKKEMENSFLNNLYRDVSDVFGRNNSSRQFYTTPNTTIPNKQNEFAKWLYGDMPSCKDASTTWKCVRFEDLRQNRKPVELEINNFQYDLDKDNERKKI